MKSLRRLPFLLTIAAWHGAALSQPDAGQLLREQQPVRPEVPRTAPDINLPRQDTPSTPAPQGMTIKLTSFRFIGDTAELDQAALHSTVKDYVGKEIGFVQLREAADRLSAYLRNQGYSTARVYLGAQEIRDGVVDLTIVLGRIQADANGNGIAVQTSGLQLKLERQLQPRLNQERIRKTVARATVGQSLYLKMDHLERGLLLLSDLPGIVARAQIDPGTEPGTARLTIEVTEGPLLTGAASLDNFGNRYTGAQRLNVQASLNDPSGSGDQAILHVSAADRLRIARLGYSRPLGYSGLRVGASHTHLSYKIGKELAVLNSQGTAAVTGANLSYPFIRTRRNSLFGILNYEHKALRDESLSAVVADKRINVASLILDGTYIDGWNGGGLTRYGLTASRGELDLSRSAASLGADQAGPRSNGGYTKAGYNLIRMQQLSSNWTFFGALSGQLASKNLDSSEKFVLGGPTGIRAYPSGEASGDQGWLANLELRYDIAGGSADRWQLVAFYDVGGVLLHKNTWAGWNAGNPNQPNRYRLTGAGLGINFVRSASHAVSASYAQKIGRNPARSAAGLDADGRQDDSRIWLQGTIYF